MLNRKLQGNNNATFDWSAICKGKVGPKGYTFVENKNPHIFKIIYLHAGIVDMSYVRQFSKWGLHLVPVQDWCNYAKIGVSKRFCNNIFQQLRSWSSIVIDILMIFGPHTKTFKNHHHGNQKLILTRIIAVDPQKS